MRRGVRVGDWKVSGRIAIVDTYYTQALAALSERHPEWAGMPYQEHLDALLWEFFGTGDAWSRNLRPLGWDAIDVIGNADALQAKWFAEHRSGAAPMEPWQVAAEQVEDFGANVVLLQDVSFFPAHVLWRWQAQGRVVAAQCSCPMPPADRLRHVDVCFTSFPHYAGEPSESGGELRRRGVRRVEFMPLAFEPDVLQRLDARERMRHDVEMELTSNDVQIAGRDIPIAFVGGVGKRIHWKAGTEALEAVASKFGSANFHWYGYGREYLDDNSPLFACWRGEAWGLDMYRVYQRARIVVNRHGEVARGYANCMRLYEANGCSALVLTESAPNLAQLFPDGGVVGYDSPADLCAKIERYLGDERDRAETARIGEGTVRALHTFAQRMTVVDRVLREELERRKKS